MAAPWLDGLLLAATARSDAPDAVMAGLAPGLRAALEDRLDALARRDAAGRHAEIRRLAAALRFVPSEAALPPRAAALLAPDVPREVGRAWAAASPPVRRGFRVDADLKATLRRLAAPADERAEADELAAADAVGASFTPAKADSLKRWAARLASGTSPRRVLGALALGARGETGGDARSRPWRRIGAELAHAWSAPWR